MSSTHKIGYTILLVLVSGYTWLFMLGFSADMMMSGRGSYSANVTNVLPGLFALLVEIAVVFFIYPASVYLLLRKVWKKLNPLPFLGNVALLPFATSILGPAVVVLSMFIQGESTAAIVPIVKETIARHLPYLLGIFSAHLVLFAWYTVTCHKEQVPCTQVGGG